MNTNTQQINRINTPATPVAPASEKTAEQRKLELVAFLKQPSTKTKMPDEVRAIVDMIDGLQFKMGDQSVCTVPGVLGWGQYQSSKGKTAGQTVFTALGRFQSVTLGELNGYRLTATVSLAILPV